MRDLESYNRQAGSFRDPSGHIIIRNGEILRQVNKVYKEHYDLLISSGLYQSLVDDGLLIPHEEIESEPANLPHVYKLLKPERIKFISYPYEWSFSEFKGAALATLQIQKEALRRGMILKDASNYNIQFNRGKPVFIDTLSFTKYEEGQPWQAYRQFCQHFLAPIALMSYKDVRLSRMLRLYPDGIPLDLASSLLPARTRLSLPLLMHLHLHAKSQLHYAERQVDVRSMSLSLRSLNAIIDQLESLVKHLTWRPRGTEWTDYDIDASYSPEAFSHKRDIVADFLNRLNPETVWDLGSNTGIFSRMAGAKGAGTISFDVDPAAVEINYLNCVKENNEYVLPLLIDFTNPSPGLGWENKERMSLIERGPADTLMALALVHHLAITNNTPLADIADFFKKIGKHLIIEFVPKSDPRVRRMLSSREDIFTNYTVQGFEEAFKQYFTIESVMPIKNSERTMYLMTPRGD
jgi:ribosomal protein L11 methylase PrmA